MSTNIQVKEPTTTATNPTNAIKPGVDAPTAGVKTKTDKNNQPKQPKQKSPSSQASGNAAAPLPAKNPPKASNSNSAKTETKSKKGSGNGNGNNNSKPKQKNAVGANKAVNNVNSQQPAANSGNRPANLMDIKLAGGQLINGYNSSNQQLKQQQQQQQPNVYVVYKAPNLMDLNMQNVNSRDLFSTSAPSKTEFVKTAENFRSQQNQHQQQAHQYKQHTVAGSMFKDGYSRQYQHPGQRPHNLTGKMSNNDRKYSENNEEAKCSFFFFYYYVLYD
jgi:hypothetical protein